jgi:hypothetical protein
MTPENELQIGKHAAELNTTKRIPREPQEAPEPEQEAEEKKSLITKFQAAFRLARDRRLARAGAAKKEDRTAKSTDRSKGLVALLVCGFLVALVLVGMFSHSSGDKPGSAAKRTKPSLGRREQRANSGQEKRGSVTPLHNADLGNQNPSSDEEVDAEDIKRTARVRLQPRQEPKAAPTLASIPADPALESYRRSREGNIPLPPPPPTAATVAAPAPRIDSDGLKKASLLFVRNDVNGTAGLVRPAVASTQPALLERKNSGLLPAGSKLVARFQAAVSTAVKTPVVAAIEYNYECDGEIIIPAGTKAFGELQQANRSGIVNVRFHTLQMADGTTQEINGTAVSLSYGPLKGTVSGSNRAKRILVRSLTGVGTMAAFLVGGPGGFSGASGALDNSILLRERIASNAGLAGEQELMSLALNENIVITVPANTRFFIVLQNGSGDNKPAGPRTLPERMPERNQAGGAVAGSRLPTAQELRELMELKSELNRMQGEVTASSVAAQPPQQEE